MIANIADDQIENEHESLYVARHKMSKKRYELRLLNRDLAREEAKRSFESKVAK